MNWIPYEKQKPTREDANSDGDVLWRCAAEADHAWAEPWLTEWNDFSGLYWLSIPDYPGAKSKDEQDLAEFKEWWNDETKRDLEPWDKELALEAWLTARKR